MTIFGEARSPLGPPRSSPAASTSWTSRPPEEADSAPDWFVRALNVPHQVGTVDFDGAQLRAYAWGDEDKPGLILAHGFMAHAMCLGFVGALLSDHFRVVAYDLAGMGDSGLPVDFETTSRGRELLAVAEASGLLAKERKPFLVSHSQGGHSAMGAIEDSPEAFAGFVLADMMMLDPETVSGHMKVRRADRWPREPRPHLVHGSLGEILPRFKLAPPQQCRNKFLVDYVAENSVKKVEGGFSWKFDSRVLITDGHPAEWWAEQPNRFCALALRRAILHGEQSSVFTDVSRRLMRSLTKGQVPIIGLPEAHHHLMLDQPLAFVVAVRAILEGWLAEDCRAKKTDEC